MRHVFLLSLWVPFQAFANPCAATGALLTPSGDELPVMAHVEQAFESELMLYGLEHDFAWVRARILEDWNSRLERARTQLGTVKQPHAQATRRLAVCEEAATTGAAPDRGDAMKDKALVRLDRLIEAAWQMQLRIEQRAWFELHPTQRVAWNGIKASLEAAEFDESLVRVDAFVTPELEGIVESVEGNDWAPVLAEFREALAETTESWREYRGLGDDTLRACRADYVRALVAVEAAEGLVERWESAISKLSPDAEPRARMTVARVAVSAPGDRAAARQGLLELIGGMATEPALLQPEAWAGLWWRLGVLDYLDGDRANARARVQQAVVAMDGEPLAVGWLPGELRDWVLSVEVPGRRVELQLDPGSAVAMAVDEREALKSQWLLPGWHRITSMDGQGDGSVEMVCLQSSR